MTRCYLTLWNAYLWGCGKLMRAFRFWCQKVLPLVYDDSLSYYEVLCKVVQYINELIAQDKIFAAEIDELKMDLAKAQEWIDTFNTDMIASLVEEYLATMVMFGLTDSGYFITYIPSSWKTINFNTTGYDIQLSIMPEYGHLVLSY